MKSEKKLPPHLAKIFWEKDNPKMFSVFNKKKLMILTSFCAVFVFAGAIISYFFIMNPFQYSYELIKNIKTPDYDLIKAYVYVKPSDLTIFDGFKATYASKTATDHQIMDYVFYNQDLGGVNTERLLICNLIFCTIQFFAALVSYNLRNFYGKWKMDALPLIMFESLTNLSTLSIFAIWFLLEFGNDFSYFIYLNYHIIIHYLTFLFAFINLILKGYIFFLGFYDYFTVVNNKLKKEQ